MGTEVTYLIFIGNGRGQESHQALALSLEGGKPSLCTKAHAGTDKWAEDLMNTTIIILRMFNPCNLQIIIHQHMLSMYQVSITQS